MKFPENLKYTKDHEWVDIQGNRATIGITEHAQSALGDIVFIELPPVGKSLRSGDSFGVVESIKAVSDLYAPVSGKVLEANPTVISDPSSLNRDPYVASWLIRVELDGSAPAAGLMDSSTYTSLVDSLK
jgi:glycine cleavage system H protein